MKYELTIRELTEFTKEELQESRNFRDDIGYTNDRFSDKPFHQVKVLQVEVTQEELQAIKKAVIEVF